MTEPRILAIETATSACSVAINSGAGPVSRAEVGNNVHSKVLLDMVAQVLAEAGLSAAELDAVAVGQGPGSFTGLRIGVGVAQGIAYGADCPMLGISSLDVLANQVPKEGVVIAGIDARMGELYWCEYQKTADSLIRNGPLQVSPPESIVFDVNVSNAKPQLVGNAWAEYQGRFDAGLMEAGAIDRSQLFPSADSLLSLSQQSFQRGEFISATSFAPEYVRNNVAKKSTA